MGQEEQKLTSLPDNAYRELNPGEEYKPIMPAGSKPKEVTPYSVIFGIIMAIRREWFVHYTQNGN